MVTINWCLQARNGIELIEPNLNMSESYMLMAEESLRIIRKIGNDSRIWLASASYYTMYYCLYSVMIRMGIKCEIHQCSIELMKNLLHFYSAEDIDD